MSEDISYEDEDSNNIGEVFVPTPMSLESVFLSWQEFCMTAQLIGEENKNDSEGYRETPEEIDR